MTYECCQCYPPQIRGGLHLGSASRGVPLGGPLGSQGGPLLEGPMGPMIPNQRS